MTTIQWHRILATVMAIALINSGVAIAAEIGANLVNNADFENVSLTMTGEENGPQILGWSGRSVYAYSHDGSSSSTGVVPDYAQGPNPPNGGHWYFTPTNTAGGPDIDDPDEVFQEIDVSTGPTGELIAAGRARYYLSAWMSSLANDDGRAWINLQFLDSRRVQVDVDGLIGPETGPSDVWQLRSLSQEIQPNVAIVRLSIFGNRQTGGPNGYIDNITFSVAPPVPEPSSFALGSLLAVSLASLRLRLRPRRVGSVG